MSLQLRLGDFITAIGTDYKQLRSWITGSTSGNLTGLTTTDKASLLGAINEVNAKPSAAPASEVVAGVAEFATQAETTTGTDDGRTVTPLKLAQKLTAWAQPLSANLTSLAGAASTAFGRARLNDADAAAAKTALALTKTDVGLANVPNTDATARANHTGTQAVGTITGLAAVATSGSASDITTGTLPTSVMPLLAVNDTFTVATQAAMLALTAQRGDVAVRSDISRNFILAVDDPTVLANWVQMAGGSDVLSVAGRTGAVALTKTDVGLSLADNVSDANKPVSTAQATAIALKLAIASNLSDLNNVATARTNLSVYSQTEMGNPETDLVALYVAAKV